MTLNINQPNDLLQDQLADIERFIIFRFPHGLGKGIKNRIKSLGCSWSTLHHGWLCPLSKQQEVQQEIEKSKLTYNAQAILLPMGMISSNPKITGRQIQLEILEMQTYKDEEQLLKDVYQYHPSLRPEDFALLPSEESKSPYQIQCEQDFHRRWTDLEGSKESAKRIRQEISHLNEDPGEKILDSEAPLLSADSLIEQHFRSEGLRTLQYCSNAFWKWEGSKYIEVNENGMRQTIYHFLRDAKKLNDSGHLENFNPTKYKVDQIFDALQAICHLDHSPASGTVWVDGRKEPNPRYLISFRNGLLDIRDWLLNNSAELIPHTPSLLNVNSLEFDFDPHALEPHEWLKFLDAIWPQDTESQQTLQEWMGYLLTQDTRQHKILLIVGPPRSGKGTIGRVMHELLGAFNVAGPTLSSLGGEFGLQPLLNKMLATISDARLNGRGNNSLIIERLLSISGEDPLTINRKFLPSLTIQLPTRIMMMSNELPDMRDASGALAKRYIVLTLQKSWFGQEDTSLFQRLCAELPGILLWALRGLAQLQQRGKFLQPASSAQTVEELEAMTSPIKAFISEKCEIKPHASVPVAVLFEAWRIWCSATGYPQSGNVQSFGKNLRAAFPAVAMSRPQEAHTRGRCYMGISLISIQNQSADVRRQSWEDFE